MFVESGASVVALEPAPAMASRLQRRLPSVETMVRTLEDADLPDESFDAAIAATAFHWVDPDIGLPKLHAALVPNGLLAVWRTVYGDPDFRTGFRKRVAEIAARRPTTSIARPDPLAVDEWMLTLTAGGLFAPVDVARLRWPIELTTEQIRALFGTFSDWSRSEVDEAAAFVADLGGSVTEHYVTVLCVCRAVKVG